MALLRVETERDEKQPSDEVTHTKGGAESPNELSFAVSRANR
jgi:hypothetical protein